MINSLIVGVFNLVISLVNVLLLPIDTLINSLLPDFANALNMVNAFLDFIISNVEWAVSWLGFNSTVITLFVAYTLFRVNGFLIVHTFKMAIKWFNSIKPI